MSAKEKTGKKNKKKALSSYKKMIHLTFLYKNYSLSSMSVVFIICTAVLTAGVISLLVFLLRSFIAPQKLETIEKLIRNGKRQQAIKMAKSIISKNPRDTEAHYILGKAYLADNKPELALMEFKAVNSASSFSNKIPEQEFRRTIAKLYLKFNQQEEALKEYLLLIKNLIIPNIV